MAAGDSRRHSVLVSLRKMPKSILQKALQRNSMGKRLRHGGYRGVIAPPRRYNFLF